MQYALVHCFMVLGLVYHGAWCMVHGAWCMVHGIARHVLAYRGMWYHGLWLLWSHGAWSRRLASEKTDFFYISSHIIFPTNYLINKNI